MNKVKETQNIKLSDCKKCVWCKVTGTRVFCMFSKCVIN